MLAVQPSAPPGTKVREERAAAREAALVVTDLVQVESISDIDADGVACRLYRP